MTPRRTALLTALAATSLAPLASAQLSFSVDWRSRSLAQPASNAAGAPITEGDILAPAPGAPALGPLGNASIRRFGGELLLQNFATCQGHQPLTPCGIEVDALSSGQDDVAVPGVPASDADRRRYWFSVDEWATGRPPVATPLRPQVITEGNNPAQVWDACADVFCDVNVPAGPLPPLAVQPNNVGTIDGNGLASAANFAYFGIGLREPNNPSLHNGDNLDALEIGPEILSATASIYFSLDAAFPDLLNSTPNSGSAALNGFRGADVVRVRLNTGLPLSLYASATSLGLDLAGVPGSDDLDALCLRDNGDGVFQPSQTPYDWIGGTRDMLLFSVRRGSAVINQPDSIFGVPIQPGDILTTPLPTALGGLSPFPGIFMAAENLGLRTARGSTTVSGDDLDALDITKKPCFDCNENGVEDAVDIATGASSDNNHNGIPDECEDKVVEVCKCNADAPAPCGNSYAPGGCANSTGVGAILETNIAGGGSVGVAADNLTFTTTQMRPNISAVMYMGPANKPAAPFDDGVRCIANSPTYRYAIKNSRASGTVVYGPGVVATSAVRFGPAGTITAGSTWYFQTWYRDPGGPCGQNANLSNVVRVTYEP
ncbi:MAG: hypothetical protein JNN27_16310 [Planctomycetes bacterium]|nr:hypothetical protein [Planctomycetota bacterium]